MSRQQAATKSFVDDEADVVLQLLYSRLLYNVEERRGKDFFQGFPLKRQTSWRSKDTDCTTVSLRGIAQNTIVTFSAREKEYVWLDFSKRRRMVCVLKVSVAL